MLSLITYERPDLAKAFVDQVYERFNERPHPYDPKSAGITTLVGCLRKAYLRRRGVAGEASEAFKLIVAIGTAYHAMLPNPELPRETHYVMVVEDEDGPVGTITGYADWEDTLTVDESDGDDLLVYGVDAVAELKTVRSSSNKPPSAAHVEQLAGNWVLKRNKQCEDGLDPVGPYHGLLYVVHLVGSYHPPFPVVKTHEYEFSDDDLDRWGQELGRRLKVLVSGEDPGTEETAKWECKNCQFHGEICPGAVNGRMWGFFE